LAQADDTALAVEHAKQLLPQALVVMQLSQPLAPLPSAFLKPTLQVGTQAVAAATVLPPAQAVADALVVTHAWQSVPQRATPLHVFSQPLVPSESALA
jgi:hypothetical protein